MITFDQVTGENTQERNPRYPQISNHLYRIQVQRGSGSGRTNVWLNLINYQSEIYKIFLYAKDLYEPKYHYFINNIEKVSLKHTKDPKAFIKYSFDMKDIYFSIEKYNPRK